MTKWLVLILFLMSAWKVPMAWGEEVREFYTGVRGLAMGGAQIAAVNDETALIVNPAALGRLRNTFLTVFDPEIEGGMSTERIVGTDVTAFMDPQQTLDLMNDGHHEGRHFHQGVKVFPSFVAPNFGMGILGQYRTDASLSSDGSEFDYDYRNDFAFLMGYNFRLLDGRMKLGFNLKMVNRVNVSETVPSSSSGLAVSDLATEGLGIGSDVGLILTAPWDWLPTLTAVWRDVGGTQYDFQDGLFMQTEDRPAASEGAVDVGVGLFPIASPRARFSFVLEARDVLTLSETDDIQRRLHSGVEFNFRDAFFLRAGRNQRYWSGGIEFAMFAYQFQFATYGEEIGTAENPKSDRRFVGKFAWRF